MLERRAKNKKVMRVNLPVRPIDTDEMAGYIIRELESGGHKCSEVSSGLYPVLIVDGDEYIATPRRLTNGWTEELYAVLTKVES